MGVSHTGPVLRGPVFEPLSEADPAVVSGHRLGARLGEGALGRVYYAHAPGGRPVALTVIGSRLAAEPGFAARFHRDAQAAGRVRSPWAVAVTGSGKEGDRFWIASTYVPSVSLRAAVGAAGPLPTGAVLRLVAGIARALRDIHHAGVVHGDLRPSQVLLAADGPRLKDCGIARPPGTVPGRGAWSPQTAGAAPADGTGAGDGTGPHGGTGAGDAAGPHGGTGTANGAGAAADGAEAAADGAGAAVRDDAAADAGQPSGSPVFLAPEQAAGKPAVPATDVFALGQLAAYASIGVAPFGDGPVDTVAARVRQEEPDLSELPGELREIVTRCLIKDPALRPSPAQIVAMCGQAAPESTRPSTDPWLPPALMAAIVPAVPSALPAPGAAPLPPPAPPPHPPAPVWHPQHWPRLQQVHMHIPLPPRRTRRATGALAAVTGLAVAVTAGVALAGGFRGGRDVRGVAPATVPRSDTVAGASPSGGPAGGTATGPAGTGGSEGAGATSAPAAGEPPSTAPGSQTAGPGPAGTSYLGVQVPAGYSLTVEQEPLRLLPGALDGSFGYTDQADAFVSDGRRSTLSLLAPGTPGTLAGCRSGGVQVTGVPRRAVTGRTRMCVRSADGTTTLVTFHRLSPLGAPRPYATVDLTVWRVVGRGAESDQ